MDQRPDGFFLHGIAGMALLTYVDHQSLSSWNFLVDYQKRRVGLINAARGAYAATTQLLGSQPSPAECVEALAAALLMTKPFADIIQNKLHVNPSLHLTLARQMARLMLDNEWNEITRP
jgi:hypothetical protein